MKPVFVELFGDEYSHATLLQSHSQPRTHATRRFAVMVTQVDKLALAFATH